MKKIIFILLIFCSSCVNFSGPNEHRMIMTTEMLDSYVNKKFITVLDSTFNEMGLYGGYVSPYNPKFLYYGYVDSTYYKILFNTDPKGLILSYELIK